LEEVLKTDVFNQVYTGEQWGQLYFSTIFLFSVGKIVGKIELTPFSFWKTGCNSGTDSFRSAGELTRASPLLFPALELLIKNLGKQARKTLDIAGGVII